MASLAAIPKFRSSGNPLSNPERAQERRDDYVLARMAELGFVSEAEAAAARAVPMHASPHERPIEVQAPYVAEMVRREMIARYGGDVLTRGYHVTTPIDPTLQAAATPATRNGQETYDPRPGWNTVEHPFDLAEAANATTAAVRLRPAPAPTDPPPALVPRS